MVVCLGKLGGPSTALNEPFQVGPGREGQACNPLLPSTPHPEGMLVALADGSVRTVSPKISQWTFWAACTPAGQETLYQDW